MTPVDEVNTRASGTPVAAAVASVTALTASVPLRPVKALALPELTRMAAPCSAGPPILSWQSSTAAERVAERVKAPAIVVPLTSVASITSGRSV